MQLTILQASEYAFDILKHTPATPIVHSIYRKAVNLKAGNQLLTLQPHGSVLSPISLITDCTEEELTELPFTANKALSITLKTEHASCQDLFLPVRDFEHNPVRQDFLRNREFQWIFLLHKKIRQAIALAGNSDLPPHMRGVELVLNQPDLVGESLYTNAIQNILQQFHQAAGDSAKMADTLCRLIGLGIGLTPSGDDFLCGFLAGLHLSPPSSRTLTSESDISQIHMTESNYFQRILEKKILSHLDRTNEISAAFLQCAVLGQFSAPVHLLRNPEITAEQIYQAFSGIGHSSGIDTLCGIYVSFSNIANQMPDSHSKLLSN